MTSVRLREPDKFTSLPAMHASDAQWIAELHRHQDRCGPFDTDLPAVVYKVAIDHLTDSLFLTEQTANSTFIKQEKARRDEDRAKVTKLLGSRPLPSSEARNYKGFIAGDSGCQGYHASSYWSFKRDLCNEDNGGLWKNMKIE
eukprot:1655525-Heterocapsa_arctica.AAC.1